MHSEVIYDKNVLKFEKSEHVMGIVNTINYIGIVNGSILRVVESHISTIQHAYEVHNKIDDYVMWVSESQLAEFNIDVFKEMEKYWNIHIEHESASLKNRKKAIDIFKGFVK